MIALPLPDAETLRRNLDYDAATGVLRWADRPGGKHAGKVAGSVSKADGYRRINLYQRRVLAHRVAWKILTGEDAEEVDHINGVRDDNRAINLRAASRQQNQQNKRSVGLWPKGVYFDRRRSVFVAQIKHVGRKQYIGSFPTAREAHEAYKREAAKFFGPFASTRKSKEEDVFG